MKGLLSITTILVLIVLVILMFNVKIPLCYNLEEPPNEAFILYDIEIVSEIIKDIKETPFYYIKIIGNSMKPSIKSGDACVCLPKTNYEENDIVSFYVPIEDKVDLIVHRIVTENNNQFTTKGDGNKIRDSWVINEDQIFCQIPEKNLFDKFRFVIVESGGKFNIFSIIR